MCSDLSIKYYSRMDPLNSQHLSGLAGRITYKLDRHVFYIAMIKPQDNVSRPAPGTSRRPQIVLLPPPSPPIMVPRVLLYRRNVAWLGLEE